MKSLKGRGGVIARGMSDNGKNEIGKKGVCPFWNSVGEMLLYQWYISLVLYSSYLQGISTLVKISSQKM